MILGRQGNELIPVLNKTADQVDHITQTMQSLGAGADANDMKLGTDFKEVTSQLSEAWEGIEASFSRPILQYISDNLPEITEGIQSAAEVCRFLATAVADVFVFLDQLKDWDPFYWIVKGAEKALEAINAVTGAAGPTAGSTDRPSSGSGGGNTYNVTVTHDASESGKQFGDRVIQAVHHGVRQQQSEYQAAARQRMIEGNLAGGSF